MKYLKFLSLWLVAATISVAHSGSYEDWFSAIKRDDTAAVADLLRRGFDPDTLAPDGQSGLYIALREPSLGVARVLVDWPRTNVEIRNKADESPLMMAALKGQADLVKRLLARGAHVNKPGWAALHYAATGGHVEIMALLLEEHAFIDAQSPNGTTPLMMAAMYGTTPAVKLLLDEGADIDMKNLQGLTAWDFAVRGNRPDAAKLIAEQARKRQPAGRW